MHGSGEFSARGAYLREPDFFPRFRVPVELERVDGARLDPEEVLLVVTAGRARLALMLRHLVYHHVAEGNLAGHPFVVALCAPERSCAAYSRVLRGNVLHFSAGGLHEGRALLIDDETHSYWDPRSGAALLGPLSGEQLDPLPLRTARAAQARVEHPRLELARSRLAVRAQAVAWFTKVAARVEGAPLRLLTAAQRDDTRLPADTLGVGVVLGEQAHFFPTGGLGREARARFDGRTLLLRCPPDGGAPYARWEDGPRPIQLVLTWGAFAHAFPECRVGGNTEPEAA